MKNEHIAGRRNAGRQWRLARYLLESLRELCDDFALPVILEPGRNSMGKRTSEAMWNGDLSNSFGYPTKAGEPSCPD